MFLVSSPLASIYQMNREVFIICAYNLILLISHVLILKSKTHGLSTLVILNS